MRKLAIFLAFCVLAANAAFISDILPFKNVKGSTNGGTNCATCTVVVGLVEQISIVRSEPISQVLSEICGWLPKELEAPCSKTLKKYTPQILQLLAEKFTPDQVCLKMNVCKGPQCHLFPAPKEALLRAAENPIQFVEEEDDWSLTPWEWLKGQIDKVFDSHKPLVDFDEDLFGTAKTFRGTSWRGKDCNDFNKSVYPGRKSDGADPDVDGNCNGIYGRDPSGIPYEELFCNNTKSYGTVILGDSASAHFHIPAEYLSPPSMNASTYDELLFVLENEFDWPQQSSTTAYVKVADRWDRGPIASLYSILHEHNRCNHRDYQNIGVNGARSGAMNNSIVRSFARDPEHDKPAMVMFALIGNDVCNGHPDYYNHMTKPDEFYRNVVDALLYLDSVLPPNSHVVFTGLADGRVLYDTMHSLEHPIGAGVTYSMMYDWMNCLEISPCLVWMNTNSTIRDIGSARAAELNQVYLDIIANHTFKNFDMAYYDVPIGEIMTKYTAAGGKGSDLIEPIDGFHPSQIAMALIAEEQFRRINRDHPEWLGEKNPHNEEIEKIFGDQGGY